MDRPNILFILADDLGWCDLGADGSRFHESPHLDALAAGGMRFTQAYAPCQVCSPSRASLLTGTYPTRHGITDWIGAATGEAWRQNGRHNKLLPPDYRHALDSSETTIAETFRSAGYRTFFAGKWHLGPEGSWPEDFGFDINRGGWDVGWPDGGYFAPWKNPRLESGPDGESLPLRLSRETSDFITANRHQPFFAYLSFYSVHGPLQTSQDRWERFRRKAVAQGPPASRFIFDRYLPVRQVQDCPIYGGMIDAMDEAVGNLLATLDTLGLADSTIVCFTSDNGGVSSGDGSASSMLPLRGGKGRQWEGGIRVPLYIRAPGLTTPGSQCDTPVSGIDIYATLCDLANLPIPPDQPQDGRSLTRLLAGQEDPHLTSRDLFWHYPHYGNQGGEPSSIIRSGPWKLIHYYEDNRDELYNLTHDPAEQHDLAHQHQATATTLRQRLDTWLTTTNAQLPIPDPHYDPQAEAAYLHQQQHQLMPALEAQHAEYLDPHWQPNPDWWGSQAVID